MRRLLFVLAVLAVAGVIAFLLQRAASLPATSAQPSGSTASDTPASAPANVDAPTNELASAKPAGASDDTRSPQAPPVASSAKAPVLRCLVVDPEGAPVPRAQVCVNAFTRTDSGMEGKISDTDEHGRIEFESLPKSVHNIQAAAPGFAPSVFVPLDSRVVELPKRELILELRVGARVTGEVLTADGKPESGRRVYLSATDAWDGKSLSAIADERGHFEFVDLAPGRAGVGRGWAQNEIDSITDPAQRAALRAHLLERVSILLREGESVHFVLGGNGSRSVHLFGNVSGTSSFTEALYVNAWRQAPQLGERKGARLTCPVGEQGRYDIQLDAPGPYVVSMDAPSGRVSALTLDVPDQREFQLDLALGTASVSGVVRDARGQPLAAAELALARWEVADVRKSGGVRRRLTTGADGRFQFEHLAPGRYGLSAVDRSTVGRGLLRLARCDDFALAEGEQRQLDLAFTAPASLDVDVIGPHGPMPNALVRLWDDRERASPSDTSQRTDAHGRAHFATLTAGPRWIDALTDELVAPLGGPVALVAGGSERAQVVLARGAFVDVGFESGAREVLDVLSLFDSAGRLIVSRPTKATNEASVRLGPLAPGDYWLTALAGTATVLERALHVAEAGVLALTLELPQ